MSGKLFKLVQSTIFAVAKTVMVHYANEEMLILSKFSISFLQKFELESFVKVFEYEPFLTILNAFVVTRNYL